MSDERPRRQLTLLPEVLPDPTRQPATGTSGARARTVEHMRQLLASATAATAIASCSTPAEEPVRDDATATPRKSSDTAHPDATPGGATSQPKDATPSATTSTTAMPSASTSAVATGSTSATVLVPTPRFIPKPPPPYVVVDPLPPPPQPVPHGPKP